MSITKYQRKILQRISNGEPLNVESQHYNRGTFDHPKRVFGCQLQDKIYERTLDPLVEKGLLVRMRAFNGTTIIEVFALTEAGRAAIGQLTVSNKALEQVAKIATSKRTTSRTQLQNLIHANMNEEICKNYKETIRMLRHLVKYDVIDFLCDNVATVIEKLQEEITDYKKANKVLRGPNKTPAKKKEA